MIEGKNDINNKKRRGIPTRQVLLIGGSFILGFIVLGVIAIQVWEYSNSVPFCANLCHDVHPEEIEAFQDSYHASIKCVECHMGRVGTIHNIVLKASHFRHLPEVLFDKYERPLESETMRPPNESCELCHYPPAFHGDTVREIPQFLPDEENTAKRTYLILKTAGGAQERGLGFGIHWHIVNPVEYIATDERKQEIAWVRTTLPDGRTIEYSDATNPLTPEEIASAEKHVMDCVDCHNRVGHPFPSPEDLTNESLAEGTLSPHLPYAKKEMLDLLSAGYASQEEALQAVGQVRTQYEAEHPKAAQSMQAEIQQADQLAQELLKRLVFDEPGVTWQDFPNEGGHKDFAGCFRCHDGKHQSTDGTVIRLQCNICHSIPLTVGAGDRPPEMPISTVPEPASHMETNFMADHRFQANDSCATCHGDIEFGSDDSSFCANSACHGRAWPEVDLDATFTHPIPLEGAHANVWCYSCHEGVRQPEYQCSNCHEPPSQPHFGTDCESCHTPLGWQEVTLGNFTHPIILEGAHANVACGDCHVAGKTDIQYVCADCHEPPSETHFGPNCEECHTPTSFADATMPASLHPIPLEGAHETASCDSCHQGDETPEYICENCHQRPEDHLPGDCAVCHKPTGWVESAQFLTGLAPQIPHDLEGRDNCFVCHDPAGNVLPAPANHTDYDVGQCTLCHLAEE